MFSKQETGLPVSNHFEIWLLNKCGNIRNEGLFILIDKGFISII